MNHADIDAFVKQIVVKFNPEKIILFGSRASGKASSDSDVDLFVVMSTRLKSIAQEVLIRKEIPRNFPLDLIVMKPHQIEKRKRLGDTFIHTVFSKGKILYEKDNVRVG